MQATIAAQTQAICDKIDADVDAWLAAVAAARSQVDI